MITRRWRTSAGRSFSPAAQGACALLLLAGLITGPALNAQSRTIPASPAEPRAWWVYFTDKGPDPAARLATASAAELDLDAAALRRRLTVAGTLDPFGAADAAGLPADRLLDRLRVSAETRSARPSPAPVLLDEADLPPFDAYLARVRETGAVIRARSAWLNAVSVTADAAARARLKALPFVASLQPVARHAAVRPVEIHGALPPQVGKQHLRNTAATLDYGESFAQLDLTRTTAVHDLWIDGTGSTIGMLDNGYRWRQHEALQSRRVRGEFDVIQRDSLTENEAGDPDGQDGHGTVTFSALASYKPGVLIGAAFNADYFLAKTEVNGSETPVEEDYWVEGIEWLERRGAAIVSASLGYSSWDDGSGYRYENGDFDGKTAVTTRAAARAARLGVVVVTAMGNEGNTPGSLIAPADADSVIAVGAVNYANQIAGFSSFGPTNDGRTKPDVMAPGVSVFSATRHGAATYARSSGTSLATPLAAGVAALVRSARPELTPVQVREALRATADQSAAPDSRHGWGTVDALRALLYHGMAVSTNPRISWDGTHNAVLAWVVSPHAVSTTDILLTYRVDGGIDRTERMLPFRSGDGVPGTTSGSGVYRAQLPALPTGALVEYDITAADSRERRRSPWGAPAVRHSFRVGESRMEGAEQLLPTALALGLPYPHPVCACADATVWFDIPRSGASISLDVYDMLGRRVLTLASGARSGGTYVATVPAGRLATGTHILALRTQDALLTRPLLIIK